MKFKRIYIEITNQCNLNCSFCSKSNRIRKSMEIEEFRHIINEIKDYTNMIYLHIKGEPLINNNLNSFFRICEENDINVKITTNGTLLKKCLSILKDAKNLKQINISLHCEQNIDNYFEDAFRIADELSNNIVIVYRFWILENDEKNKELSIIIDKLKNHYDLSKEFIDKIKIEKNVKIKDNIYVDKDSRFEWPSTDKEEKFSTGICYGTRTHIGILVDGTVVPCCLDGEGVVSLGNIYKTSFHDIVNSKRFKNINENMKRNIMIEELCQKCQYKIKFEKAKK